MPTVHATRVGGRLVDNVIGAWWVPWLVSVFLPVLLIFGVAFLKKLVRGAPNFARTDFYQGIELCWAVLGAAILYFYDLLRLFAAREMTASILALQLIGTIMLLGVTLMVTLAVASLHQQLEPSANIRRQGWILGVACNLAGVVLFIWFVVGIKGA